MPMIYSYIDISTKLPPRRPLNIYPTIPGANPSPEYFGPSGCLAACRRSGGPATHQASHVPGTEIGQTTVVINRKGLGS